ncbi:cation:proton antiporter domain-containing protein [Lichenicoccus roseus]|uniref:Glutathione-regulated potassium-efflux system protein KefB n=1 Tax=Lichenicoccus roseus TaxID=2683649 RepID=A0A5R9J1L5_9PROT|nr:cation:proton antiporter [Lichenicoccus roseus]TLU71524.1 glutathione-regulated potassium-efflux system protein KefB [Lichenicoccus roseus]
MLQTLVALLLASVVMVPISRRLGFGAVLGNLIGGAVIGPVGLGLIRSPGQIESVSELGVVMLLFLIGLELRPQRLWTMRRAVFGLGTAQVVATAFVLAVLMVQLPGLGLQGAGWAGPAVLGVGLALSSTAIVLPMLGERELLSGEAGRDTFAVLLLQDVAFIPLVALVPLLAGGGPSISHGLAHGFSGELRHAIPWQSVSLGAAAIVAILVGGRYLVPALFRLIGGARSPDVFTAMALLTVLGTAWIASLVGLSMSLGAFLAGVLLSNSTWRHEIQADIEPFEGVLLGFFFLSVGMSARLDLLVTQPVTILLGTLGLIAAKALVVFVLGRLAGQSTKEAVRFATALPQGSEFSFVLFAAAIGAGVLAPAQSEIATLVIALSMAATPVLFSLSERLLIPHLGRAAAPEYDEIEAQDAPVIICGVGRVGQIVGRILRTQGIRFTALDQDQDQIELLRRFGSKVYYGDPSRPDLLRAAGAETAKLLVVALADPEESVRVVEMARRTFPNLRVVARARNRRHAHLLLKLGVQGLVRETFHSSLRMTEQVLDALGYDREMSRTLVARFQEVDERMLYESVPYADDEKRLIQNSKQITAELAGLLRDDARKQSRPPVSPLPTTGRS